MVEGGNLVGLGKLYRDKKGAGRLYISKKLMDELGFENPIKVVIRIEDDKIVVERLKL